MKTRYFGKPGTTGPVSAEVLDPAVVERDPQIVCLRSDARH